MITWKRHNKMITINTWVKVFKTVKTENSLKARNYPYFIVNFIAISIFKRKFCFKTEN